MADVTVPHRHHSINYLYSSIHMWALPGFAGDTNVSRQELDAIRFFRTKPRDQWEYNRIDERISSASEYTKTHHRPQFHEGPRMDNEFMNSASMQTPKKYNLHDQFEKYTQPGSDKKFMAALAVREHWNAEESYYPGETWRNRRPSFRSAPQELLNRNTWYHWIDVAMNFDKMQAMGRSRSWNPMWPPPGYKCEPLHVKKSFQFGIEEPALVAEVERYYWYRSHWENNVRMGLYEAFCTVIALYPIYCVLKSLYSYHTMKTVYSNMWYPGRTFLRPTGIPKDPEREGFWWQVPLDKFPNQGEVWFVHEILYKYIHLEELRVAQEAAERVATI